MKTDKLIFLLTFLAIVSGCTRLFELETPQPLKPTQFRVFNPVIGKAVDFGINGRTQASLAFGKFSDFQVLEGTDTVKIINIDDPAGIGTNLVTQTVTFTPNQSYSLFYINIPGTQFDLPKNFLIKVPEETATPLEGKSKMKLVNFVKDNSVLVPIIAGISDSLVSEVNTVSDTILFQSNPNSSKYSTPYQLLNPGSKVPFVRSFYNDDVLNTNVAVNYIFKPVYVPAGKTYSIITIGTLNKNDSIPLQALLVEDGTANILPLTVDRITSTADISTNQSFGRVIYAAYNVSTYGPFVGFDRSGNTVYLFKTFTASLNADFSTTLTYPNPNPTSFKVAPGNYLFRVTPEDYISPYFFEQNVVLEKGKGYNFLLKPDLPKNNLKLQILENDRNVPEGVFRLRIAHLLQGKGNVEIRVADIKSEAVIKNVAYDQVSAYVDLPPSAVDVRVFITKAGTGEDLFPSQKFRFPFPNRVSGTLLLSVSTEDEPYLYGKTYSDYKKDNNPRFPDEDVDVVNGRRKTPYILFISDDGSNIQKSLYR
jgi:hypothetical protein